MNLHLNSSLYKEAITVTARQINLRPEFIEKDYWVTLALNRIFKSEIGKDTIFKGGTALSKCYSFIERFSEDIDLVVLRHKDESDSKLKSKLKKISSAIEAELPEVEISEITRKMGMNRKTAHDYKKVFKGKYGQVRDVLILESSWLGNTEPYSTNKIVSLVGEMMLNNNQEEIAIQYDLLPFELNVLEPSRTICEKIMSLVRFSHSNNPIDDLKNKIRHIYDLNRLLSQKEFLAFFFSNDFDAMLLKVGNDDKKSFRNNNEWLSIHPSEAIIFKDLDRVWNELKSTYSNEFRNLVYGNLPDEKEAFGTLNMIKERIAIIVWNIELESK